MIEASGVRNSWLMYDRKRLFKSAASRSCSAFWSSSAYSATTPLLVSVELGLQARELRAAGDAISALRVSVVAEIGALMIDDA